MPDNYGIFRSGTSGLVLREPNKQALPPGHRQKHRLTYYAALFNSIEINSSFYTIPMAVTFTKWSHLVPPGFQFTLKLWRGITHARGFVISPADIALFMKAAANLADKKGCLLIQLPPNVTWNKLGQLEKMLTLVQAPDAGPAWRIAVEFRDRSWYRQETYDLLDRFQSALVLHDMPAASTHTPAGKAGFTYIRFHGIRGDYKGSYTHTHLEEYAKKIRNWLHQGKDVYAYFNNTIGDAVANLETLNILVS
ncbi:MAG: DUF72 domain-containing protein [Chitinophagaceae bacterium]|nr:DUF72 domain-containing protein [Chitinophagaceae bacterium]